MTASPVTTPNPWGTVTPRRWQADALPLIIAAVRAGQKPVVSAVMGSGKSILLAALAGVALANLRPNGSIVVVAPTERLVRQLSGTLADMLGPQMVGQYYGRRKQPHHRVVVACAPSLASLTAELAGSGRRCQLLIVDEAHRSEAEQIRGVTPVLKPAALVGFTATPYRSATSEALSLYSDVVYRYTWADGRRDGVLVPPRYVWDHEAGERADLDQQCLALIQANCVGPGVISARTIEDAEQYAAWLRGWDYPAEAIHSRMRHREQDDKIERLRTGALSALVHVALLAEGVDFPWLRWLCLRRPVGARVRLVQEVGRGSRAFPGKSEFVCVDPHNLIGVHGLSHPEAIGEALEEMEEEAAERAERAELVDETITLPPGPTVDLTTQWAQLLLLSLQEEGAAPARTVADGLWRTRRPSAVQLNTVQNLGRAFSRHLPDEHRGAVLAMSRRPVAAQLQRGAVSDLISILRAVADAAPKGGWEARKGWKFDWPEGLVVAPLQEGAMRGMKKFKLEEAPE